MKRFKWQIAQELRANGKIPDEIAEIMGVRRKDVFLYLAYAKNRTSKNVPTQVLKYANFAVGELKHRFAFEAEKRALTMRDLADRILANVIESDLFTAVLDD